MSKIAFCLAGLYAAAGLHQAQAAGWKMDAAAGNRLEFIATFEQSPATGVFKDFDVRFDFDPEKPAGGRLDVSIRVSSADMASVDINKAIATREWFDFARYQQAEFHANDIRRLSGDASAGRYLARGVLSLKGVQQPVEVPFAWKAAGAGAMLEGEFVLKRAAFGIGTGEWAATDTVGADVTVKFRVKLNKP
ncbi:MAG: YceI family protein [Comamonas sp.]|nr:YceI family protein [Comamonas sp.]